MPQQPGKTTSLKRLDLNCFNLPGYAKIGRKSDSLCLASSPTPTSVMGPFSALDFYGTIDPHKVLLCWQILNERVSVLSMSCILAIKFTRFNKVYQPPSTPRLFCDLFSVRRQGSVSQTYINKTAWLTKPHHTIPPVGRQGNSTELNLGVRCSRGHC